MTRRKRGVHEFLAKLPGRHPLDGLACTVRRSVPRRTEQPGCSRQTIQHRLFGHGKPAWRSLLCGRPSIAADDSRSCGLRLEKACCRFAEERRQPGAQATFYTEGWIFGSGVAVKELGHDFNAGGGVPAEGSPTGQPALGQMQKQISDQDLQDRIASSDLVVIGRITDVHRWTIPKSAAARYHVSEHSADWHEAVLQIKSILKGTKPKGNKMAVRFPLSRDVAWVNSPKFQKQQQGIFFLKKDQVSGDPTASIGGYQVDAYTSLKPGDWLPLSDEARVRSLLKN